MYVYHDINMQKLSLYIGCLDLFIVIKHGAGSLAELCGFVNCFFACLSILSLNKNWVKTTNIYVSAHSIHTTRKEYR